MPIRQRMGEDFAQEQLMTWLRRKYLSVGIITEVTFKILHGIYPAISVLERFKLEIDYSCDFCSMEK